MSDPDAIVYASGPVSCSVCVPQEWTIEQINAAVNRLNPTGIRSQWQVAEDEDFADGTPHPCPCENFPRQRQHYLLHC